MGVRLVRGRELEQAQAGEELPGFLELAGLEMRLGDLELRGLGELLVVGESLGWELER